jgi:thioredoxin 2
MVGPVVAELAGEHAGRLKVVKVNVDDNPRSAPRYQIQGIPRLLLFHDGHVVEDVVGALPKAALAQKLAPYLAA